jgi:hypothetical protein
MSVALPLFGCGGAQASNPTAPTVTPAATAAPSTYTLSGVISETTPAGTDIPVPGVRVEEGRSHRSAVTDAFGYFVINGVQPGGDISLSKPGYFPITLPDRTASFGIPADGIGFLTARLRSIPEIYTLSGVVSGISVLGRTAVAGVLIEGYRCSPGGCEVQRSTSDQNGRYSLALYAGENGIWVTPKNGYDAPAPTPGCEYCNALVTLTGDTQFDIELTRQ